MTHFKQVAQRSSSNPSKEATVLLGVLGALPKGDNAFNTHINRFAEILGKYPGTVSPADECVAVIHALNQRKFEIKASIRNKLPDTSLLKYAIGIGSNNRPDLTDEQLNRFLDCEGISDIPRLYLDLIDQWVQRGHPIRSNDWIAITDIARDKGNPEHKASRALISANFGSAAAFLTAEEFATHLNIVRLVEPDKVHVELRDFLAIAEFDVANTHIDVLLEQHSEILEAVVVYAFNSLTADDQDAIKRLTHAAKFKPLMGNYYLRALSRHTSSNPAFKWAILAELLKFGLPEHANIAIDTALNTAHHNQCLDYLKLVLKCRIPSTVRMILAMPAIKAVTKSYFLTNPNWADSRYASELLQSVITPPTGTSSDGTTAQFVRQLFNLGNVETLPAHHRILFDSLDPIYRKIASSPGYLKTSPITLSSTVN